jgi:hypothetical protein
VKLLDRLLTTIRRSDNMQMQLFAFLASGEQELSLLGGKKLNREQARALAQELVPASIEIRAVCTMGNGAVVTAPHVSFDNWSEFFCNRIAKQHRIGWVVAKNYRDQDPHTIPVSIGRHLHVNRPTESSGPGHGEKVTERAQAVFDEYAQALGDASGLGRLPIPLLLEIHSHHRTPYLEIATSGVSTDLAMELVERYAHSRGKYRELPEMQIEPLQEIRMTADLTKRFGSLRPAIATQAFHFEIPREARQSDDTRQLMARAMIDLTGFLLDNISQAPYRIPPA